ncbi:MAG: response regulator [bacterium]
MQKTNILFVDDEPKIIRGIRRMLIDRTDEWDMSFAESGAEALELLDKKHFDVVVSDMRMPRMDGGALLKKTSELYPDTVRIILSGYSEKALIMKTVNAAHKFLSKPLDSEELELTIRKSINLRKILSNEKLLTVISRIDSIPVLPQIYKNLQREASREDFSLGKIAKIIEKNVVVAAGILKVVNSSFFGLPKEINNIEQAVSYLGTYVIKSLILFSNVFSSFDFSPKDIPSIDHINDHSIKTGELAKKLYMHYNEADKKTGEKVMIAGMMHDIGKFLLANRKKNFSSDDEITSDTSIWDMTEKEEYEMFGISHAEAGAYLLGLWSFEDPIVEAVAYHHNPDKVPGKIKFSILTVIHIAEATIIRLETKRKDTFDIKYLSHVGIGVSVIKTATDYYKDLMKNGEKKNDTQNFTD